MKTHGHIQTTPHHTKIELNFVQILFANTRQVKDEKCIASKKPRCPEFLAFARTWNRFAGLAPTAFLHSDVVLRCRVMPLSDFVMTSGAGGASSSSLLQVYTGLGLLQTSSSRSNYPSTCACANACPNFLLLLFRLCLLALLGLSASTSLLPFNSAWASFNPFCGLRLALRAALVLWTPCTSQQTRRNMLLYSLLQPLCGPPDVIVPTCTIV